MDIIQGQSNILPIYKVFIDFFINSKLCVLFLDCYLLDRKTT